MKLKLTSKSNNKYDIDWMASIDDFTEWLNTTDSHYVKVMDTWENKVLLKISEIEAITIWED